MRHLEAGAELGARLAVPIGARPPRVSLALRRPRRPARHQGRRAARKRVQKRAERQKRRRPLRHPGPRQPHSARFLALLVRRRRCRGRGGPVALWAAHRPRRATASARPALGRASVGPTAADGLHWLRLDGRRRAVPLLDATLFCQHILNRRTVAVLCCGDSLCSKTHRRRVAIRRGALLCHSSVGAIEARLVHRPRALERQPIE
mmetsp:Transcript_6513/g.21381  ORF Transcript_6513/g.21381 Transcript_6513/m.21381 type:complete len:205 (-) Transcript_6513:552-1166(-)